MAVNVVKYVNIYTFFFLLVIALSKCFPMLVFKNVNEHFFFSFQVLQDILQTGNISKLHIVLSVKQISYLVIFLPVGESFYTLCLPKTQTDHAVFLSKAKDNRFSTCYMQSVEVEKFQKWIYQQINLYH